MSHPRQIRLMVHGARGKMGARIVALARDDARFNIVAAHDVHDSAQADRLAPGSIDVLIDFSSDHGARRAATLARTLRCALLVGTTGLSQDSLDFIEQSARWVPVMVAANTSLGVAVLNHLAAEAARLLGSEFNIDLIESHHTAKRDAPSGTALRLAQALRDRAGIELPRQRIHSLRAGDIVGEHLIQFAGPGEILCISHQATNRDLFVRGALRAAAWLCGKPPGRYTIEQSLGL
ncbi:MAG: 4-hydroxy-tetrahydrodipicolinate reductase [Phycisphaerales bacterium]|nr:4-hydroxy-tetrahydrodipicolinate reductase [Phycisphaerales bacterium]